MKKIILTLALLLVCNPVYATTDIYSGLQFYYTLDSNDISGTTVIDKSGAGANGTTHGSPAAAVGVLGQALTFTGGSTVYVDISANTYNPGSGDFTLSAWLKSSTAGTLVAASSHVISGANNWWFGQTTGSAYNCAVDGTNVSSSVNGGDGKWHLVVCSRVSGTMVIYTDGKATGAGSLPGSVTAVPETISGEGISGGFYWNGQVDDFRMYNRALDSAEVYALYQMAIGRHSNQF